MPILALLAILAALAAVGCANSPATGNNQLMLVSQDQGIAMGLRANTAIIASIGLYPDAVWRGGIQQFGARHAATSERPDLPPEAGFAGFGGHARPHQPGSRRYASGGWPPREAGRRAGPVTALIGRRQ